VAPEGHIFSPIHRLQMALQGDELVVSRQQCFVLVFFEQVHIDLKQKILSGKTKY
jgi:hypothetical protein